MTHTWVCVEDVTHSSACFITPITATIASSRVEEEEEAEEEEEEEVGEGL